MDRFQKACTFLFLAAATFLALASWDLARVPASARPNPPAIRITDPASNSTNNLNSGSYTIRGVYAGAKPQKIVVYLLRQGQADISANATINNDNTWNVTINNIPAGGDYTVQAVAGPISDSINNVTFK